MKKTTTYLLIIITLIGVFVPTFKAQAGDPYGVCTFTPDYNVVPQQLTQADCIAAGGFSWTPNAFGTCTVDGQLKSGDWQEADCKENGGRWASYYYFLAPLPCDSSTPGCINGKLVSFNP